MFLSGWKSLEAADANFDGLDFLEGGWDEEEATPLPFDLTNLLIYLHKSKQSPIHAQDISTQLIKNSWDQDEKSYRIGEPSRIDQPMHKQETKETRKLVTIFKQST